jgi:hypothetical protein
LGPIIPIDVMQLHDWLLGKHAATRDGGEGGVVRASAVAVPAAPVAVMVTGVSPVIEPRRVLEPAAVPSVQEPTVATPLEPDVAVPPVIVPPPVWTVKVTSTPDIGSPF